MVERLDASVLPSDWWELSCHLWRYEYVAGLKNLGRIADCACGMGYGTNLLLNSGHDTTGFDIDYETLERNIKLYGEHFQWCDMEKFDFSGYETLVSLETIEHLNNPWTVLKSISPDVKNLIVSTPVVPTKHYNEFHKHDFTNHGLGGLVEWAGFNIEDEIYQSAPTRRNVYMIIFARRGG